MSVGVATGVNVSEASDDQLIAAYREGWERRTRNEAAEELFRRHQPRILRWCCRFTRDRESAFDLAQEILLRAYRNLDHYRGECRFSTWLYVIARNVCFSALQKRAAEPAWVGRGIALDLADASADVHEAVEREQSRSRQWALIFRTLDRTEARVMLLHYGQEVPLEAVSRMLGLTNKSGAKAYIVSARRKLSATVRPWKKRAWNPPRAVPSSPAA
jgi:RNA polymerase sigma-70 factor (ECF subfamily)